MISWEFTTKSTEGSEGEGRRIQDPENPFFSDLCAL
jgi:hypothetical protein